MKLKVMSAIILSSMLSFNAYSADISYSFVELDAGTIETDENLDGNMFGLSGSFALNDTFFIGGGVSKTSFDYDIDQNVNTLGIGAHTSIAEGTDLYGTISYVSAEVELAGLGSADDTGHGISVGVRHLITNKFEINGAVSSLDIFDDSGTAFSVGGLLHINETIDVGLSLTKSENATGYNLFLRANF